MTCLLAASAALAMGSALTDSITFDEPAHLAAGVAPLVTGDYRLSPEHPPLARMWAALPVLLAGPHWPPPETPGWHEGDFVRFSRDWLARPGAGERLFQPARAMIVALLVALCLLIALLAERLFGRGAALLALLVAALDPTLLAHGHYVTTDLPLALAALAALAAFSRFLAAPGPGRLALAGLAFAALSLVKFSWPLALPAMALMTAVHVSRRPSGAPPVRRTGAAAGPWLALAAAACLAIWAVYGFRFSPFRGADAATARMAAPVAAGGAWPASMAQAWDTVLRDPVDGRRFPAAAPLLDFARRHRLLPEAYLYGMAYTLGASRHRSAYLLGSYSTSGWPGYFPVAFVLKTPLATIALMLAGLGAIAARRVRPSDPLLALGLAAWTVTYGVSALATHLNIGQRHLLPLYPAVFMAAGAALAWISPRRSATGSARSRKAAGETAEASDVAAGSRPAGAPAAWLVAAACCWLAVACARTFPRYLSYFNELAGGSRNGYLYLADSNVDWGQDLVRLAAYARRHPGERLKLAQFGDGPLPSGFAPEILVSDRPEQPLAPLGAGTYAVSATTLLGVYLPLVRDTAWSEAETRQRPAEPRRVRVLADYRALAARAGAGGGAGGAPVETARQPLPEGARGPGTSRDFRAAPPGTPPRWKRFAGLGLLRCRDERCLFDRLRRARLLNRLRHRLADERVGDSLFLFRLSQADVDALTRP